MNNEEKSIEEEIKMIKKERSITNNLYFYRFLNYLGNPLIPLFFVK